MSVVLSLLSSSSPSSPSAEPVLRRLLWSGTQGRGRAPGMSLALTTPASFSQCDGAPAGPVLKKEKKRKRKEEKAKW
jgi:hypothetical protein